VFSKEKRYTIIHYLLGALPARLGDEMSGQAILLLGLAMTQAVALGSTILAALTFSAAVGGPLLGAILDRSSHPGRILGGALGLYAIGISCEALSLGKMPAWISIATALLAGFLMPAISGGWSSRLKSFTAEDQMTRASAIDATTFNIAGLAGPAIAGLIAAMFGAHWAVVVLIILLVAAIPMAWLLPRRSIQRASLKNSFVHDVMAGFKVIVHNEKLRRITFTSVISYMSIGMLWVIYPLVGQNLLGNAGYGGMLASIVSIGALIATIMYAKWPTRHSPDTVTLVTTLILSAAMFFLAFVSNIVLAAIVMLIIGLADGPQLAAIFAVRHREAPERSRSQVFTTGASLKITAAAIGAALAGQWAGGSLHLVIIAAGFVQLAAAAVFIVMSRRVDL
jgi:MFS family permease